MEPPESRKLSPGIKTGWAIGELAIAAYIGLSMAFMLFYGTNVLAIPPALAGAALLVPRLLDAFSDPLMGAISDRTGSKLGRRRFYLLIGAPLLAFSFGSVFFVDPALALAPKVALLMLLFLASNLAVTVYEVPYSAMAAEMTTDYRERIGLTGYKMMAARIGIILALFAGPLIFRSQPRLDAGFRLLGLSVGAFILVSGLWAFFATARAPRIDSVLHRFSLGAEYRAIVGNKPFRTLWLVFLLQNLAIGASSTTLIYFVVYAMAMDAQAAGPFLAIAGITAAIATPAWVLIGRRLGKKPAYFVALGLAALFAAAVALVAPGMATLLFILLALVGAADAGTQLLPNSMVPDTVEVDQARTGERREGALFGAWGFCRKLGMTLGAFLVSLALQAIGFHPGAATQPHDAVLGIRLIYAGLPCLLWLGAMLLLTRYQLTEARFNALKAEILAARAADA
ncbi:MAG: glycoside/pentoside/hexuronide:cation symporter, family [Sphingomonadales bacterium]|jgi:GPH family glycoside/pentoside/hexuronide:cation symporter|nr:glycoside/pentoside/hexuronide:cation symporter, family [Sphingomonadales bacterium]